MCGGDRSANEARKVSDPRWVHSGYPLHISAHLSLSYTGTNVTVVGAKPCPDTHLALVLGASPLKAEGPSGPAPAQPRQPCSSVSAALATTGARVQQRPAREHSRPCSLAALAEHREGPPRGQARPSRLDLNLPGGQAEPEARDAKATDAHVRTIKLSPTYQHVPLLEGTTRAGVGSLAPGARKQAWLSTEGLSSVPEKLVVEKAPLCLSRCSSLSSLSSAGRPGPSEAGDLDESDSSLEGLEESGPGETELDGAWRGPGAASLPMAIPAPQRGQGLGVEDATPSSS